MSDEVGGPGRPLAGTAAIVTGASRGLGREFAQVLGALGADVLIVARSRDALEESAALVRARGVRCVPVVGDVCDPGLAERCVALANELAPLRTLVNNAGIVAMQRFGDDMDVWWRVFEVNVRAAAEWSAAGIRSMSRGAGGRIVNVSSGASRAPLPFSSSYCASKAALSQMTACHSVEFHDTGLAFFAFAPVAHTDMGRQVYTQLDLPTRFRDAFRLSFERDPEGDLRRSLAVFTLLVTGAADHLSGEFIGDHTGTSFDDAASIAARHRDPLKAVFEGLTADA